MRKFNATEWQEIEPSASFHSGPKGRLWVRATGEVQVFVQQEGVEALAGVGTEVDVLLDSDFDFRIAAPSNTRVFVFSPFWPVFEPEGEVFTNADRMPMESGSLLAVRQELRMFRLEQKRAREEARRRMAGDPLADPVEPAAPPAAEVPPAE